MSVLTPEGLNFAQAQLYLRERGWVARTVSELFEHELKGVGPEKLHSKFRNTHHEVIVISDSVEEYISAGLPVDMFVRPSSGNAYQAMLASDGKIELAARHNGQEWYDSFTRLARAARPFASVSITFPETLHSGVIKAVLKYHGVAYASALPRGQEPWEEQIAKLRQPN